MKKRNTTLHSWEWMARCAVAFVLACNAEAPELVSPPPIAFNACLQATDEDGMAIRSATVLATTSTFDEASGTFSIPALTDSFATVVSAPGYIPEPVVVARGDEECKRVILHSSDAYVALHFAGDVMLARRYEAGVESPLLSSERRAADAAEVVSSLAPLFAAADFRVVNLETVVSTSDDMRAYPKKRFLLRTHPDSLAALQALHVDLAVLANNHTRDWLDLGVQDTIDSLDRIALPRVGAGLTQSEAEQAHHDDVRGLTVGTLAYTTVDGDFVNDNYPSEVSAAATLPENDRWLAELRHFGVEIPGLRIPFADRTIGEAWRVFKAREPYLSEDTIAHAWSELTLVYPELQDWVARRGHGGAAYWGSHSIEQIRTLAETSDLTVVQVHAGFQFQEAPSGGMRSIARQAIDAGADLVIAHHPHILQGAEFYRGKLIFYSLGNFVFDQDFLSTFQGGFLRVLVSKETREAAVYSFVPSELVGYRPTPLAGEGRLRVLRELSRRSGFRMSSTRFDDLSVGSIPWFGDGMTVAALFRDDGIVTPVPAEGTPTNVPLTATEFFTHSPLAQVTDATEGVEVSRELLGWGDFEDDLADDRQTLAHFDVDSEDGVLIDDRANAASGSRFLRLRRYAHHSTPIYERPVARIPIALHRLFDPNGFPVDGVSSFEVRFLARHSGRSRAPARVRLDYYFFTDADPTRAPASVLLGSQDFSISEVTEDWGEYVLSFTPPEGANAMLVYVGVAPPRTWEALLDIDRVRVLEWRAASEFLRAPTAFHSARSLAGGTLSYRVW